MKEFLRIVLRIIGKLKTDNIDNNSKVENLNEELEGFLSQFKTISDKIDENNKELRAIMEEEEQNQISETERLERYKAEIDRKIKESQDLQTNIKLKLDKNEKVKSKIDEFVV